MVGIGVVLSGGGARGIAHLGVLKALEEIGIQPDILSGVSAGALIGALYAAGHSPEHILELVKTHTSSSLVRMILSPSGLFSPAGLGKLLKETIPHDSFDLLQVPLYVTATDIGSGESVTFSEGQLHPVLIGSSSIPGLFTPVKFGRHYLVDGGVRNNLPVSCIRDKCHKVLGSHVNKLYHDHPEQLGRFQVLEKSFHLAVANTVAAHALQCDIFLEPELQGHQMFETRHADQLFKAGYDVVLKQRDLLRSWI
ncbi:patatin-like phospholipase family protein [Mucilaginibacter sp. HC2]|uniref:patatin-like phospholipase family protein n=1 Tax=Mucilaginibacter inviolabilis TaxID=2714892 RepID=UPI001409A49B|nr:patatin-like phospholipase family protein [Mucilaginibacter inviolabilis]NHA03394.1 patatin-like phospholipase family protein [Mucilaginibacter inviolabilis]